MTPSPIDSADIYPLFGVREPYFALNELTFPSRGVATATIHPELPPTRELAPITLGEASRHLAILGLCAAASTSTDGQRRYYLARDAMITWLPDQPLPTTPVPLTGNATGRLVDARNATAQTTLSFDGMVLAHCEITYNAIAEAVFQRLFSYANRPGLGHNTGTSPYTRHLPLHDITHNGTTVHAHVTAEPDDVAGHFYDYPTLPAAVLGTVMGETASLVLDNLTGKHTRWVPGTAQFSARRLPPAGKTVELEAKPVTNPNGNGDRTIAVTASTDGTIAATLALSLRVVDD